MLKKAAILTAILIVLPLSVKAQLQGSIFGRAGSTFTTGSQFFNDATGAFTVGTKQPLSWNVTDGGFEYPASFAVVGLASVPIGVDGPQSQDVQSIQLGFENHFWTGLSDIRIVVGGGADIEVNDPSGAENTNLGLTFGLAKNIWWKQQTRSGLVGDFGVNTFKRNETNYATVNVTLTLFLPSSP